VAAYSARLHARGDPQPRGTGRGPCTVHPPQRIEPGDRFWPRALTDIEAPPEVLWGRGRLELLLPRPCVAIVGSRAPTPYGIGQAARFAAAFASAGVVVASGMARGIDEAAHRGALRVGGDTVAVLGSGVDVPWPAGPLAQELAERGLLVSEFEPGRPPRRHHFPLRNRLISGLAQAVVVVEAAHASGSLVTARWAVDQGRSVYAIPGRIDHPMSRGSHRLIREGGLLLEDPEEVLDEILGPAQTRPTLSPAPGGTGAALDPRQSSPIEEALRGETLSADELAERLSLSPQTVLVELVQLDLEERVIRGPGGLYRLP
jgi:DNA processing protein